MSAPSASECPALLELEQWIAGELESGLGEHVRDCDNCAELVREIRDNNELLERLGKTSIPLESTAGDGVQPHGSGETITIEGYEVLGEIHRGGQGVVYRAVQQTTNRIVAVKVLLAGSLATSRQRRRFEREIELVAHLSHPNIVTVYDSGETSQGHHYLVMEYIEGQPLDQWMSVHRLVNASRGRLDVRRIVKIFGRICNGVNCAHQHGVIHRDLKPANILVDAHGQPRILDFGLAKDLFEVSVEGRQVSMAGEFMGTIAFAAPEQTTGDPNLTDVRTDVYALGVLLYQALTGTFPYPIDGELVDVLNNIRQHDPQPMKPVFDGRARIDADLETIVRTALAKEAERRYQSVAALRDDLHHWMSGEPINARRDSGWYVLRKTLNRYRMQTSIAAIFLVLLVVFSVAMSLAYRKARTEASKVREINVFLEDTLGSVEAGQSGGEVTLRELLDEAVQWIEIALSDQPEVAASIQTTVGNSYRNLGAFE